MGLGVGVAVGAVVGIGVAVDTVSRGRSLRRSTISTWPPPQAISNITAVERRSSCMDLIFTQAYYYKCLLTGSTAATVWLEYAYDPLLYRKTSGHRHCTILVLPVIPSKTEVWEVYS